MQVWLKNYEDTEALRLPVLPPTVEIAQGNSITSVNLPAVGEVAILGKGRLFGLTLSSFFPAQFYPFCDYSDFPAPDECVAMLERWRLSGYPIRVIITDTPINMLMGVEGFTYAYGKGKDLNFSLVLKEYKVIQFTAVQDAQEPAEPPAGGGNGLPKTHVVARGDTLWKISRKYYGRANWTLVNKIVAANQKNPKITNPNLIVTGWRLVIPK